MTPRVAIFTIGATGIIAGSNRWKYFLIVGILMLLVTAIGILIQKNI
ncbi:hypothetical protein [Clostridioides sp. ZZV15-6598]